MELKSNLNLFITIINESSTFVSFGDHFDSIYSAHFMELADGRRAHVVLGKGTAKLFDAKGNLHVVLLYKCALYSILQ